METMQSRLDGDILFNRLFGVVELVIFWSFDTLSIYISFHT